MPADSAFSGAFWRTFNYSDLLVMTEAAAGAGTFQVYRTNDLYDPDFTGVGHQPMFFDQLCSSTGPYLNFVVPSAEFDLRISNTTAYPTMLVVLLANYTGTPSSRTVAMERSYGWKKLLAPNGTGGATVDKKIKVNNVVLSGTTKQQYLADYYGNYGTSPPLVAGALPCALQICVYGTGAVAASVTVSVNAKFHAKLWGLGPEVAS